MWANGRLSDHGIDFVLSALGARNSSGTLSVEGEDVLAVRFRNGEIVGADALKESLTHGLGRILVAAGHLNRDQVASIESTELSGSVVDHLLATGMVPAETLAGCVRQHTYLLLVKLLGWKAGNYQFYEGEVVSGLAVRPLSVEEVLVRASEEDPALLGGTVPALGDEVLRPLLGRRAFRVLNWQQDPELASEGNDWLTPFEDALLRSLDGLTPVSGFREALGVDEFRLRFALHRLRRMGLVEAVGGDPAVARPLAPAREAIVEGEIPELLEPPPIAPPPVAVKAPRAEPAAPPKSSPWTELGGQLGDLSRAFSYVLSAGLAVVTLVLVLGGDSVARLHQPFPWQQADRQGLENLRLQAQERDLTGKLKTYRILFGTFPLDLRPLVDLGLVRASDVEDSHGRGVVFEALDNGFVLGLDDEDAETRTSPRTHFSVAGDFLLDPDFMRVEGRPGGTPVQVLD